MKRPRQSAVDKAFQRSDKHVLHGIRLKPWTPARVIAAQGMGLIWPNIGKEGWDQYQRTKTYPRALRDTIIVLWLCTQTEPEVDEADRAPQEAYARAREWAAKLGIHKLNSDLFWQAFQEFVTIVSEVEHSARSPASDGEDEEDNPGNE